jgi:hypothetical protein
VKSSAFDCISRGLATLRANWQLVPLIWLQNVLVVAITVAGALVPVVVLGTSWWAGLEEWRPTSLEEVWLDFVAAVQPVALPLSVALLATGVVWLLAFLLFCWFQAGFFGVLMAAERQALPGQPRDWRLFRTFTLRDFAGWGRRWLWRYFGFWNLYLLVVLAWMLVVLLAVWGTVAGGQRWGGPAAAGIGCGAALPLAFSLVVLAAWAWLTPPDLAREEGSVGRSSRRALEVITRRPGAVLLLGLVFVAASLFVAIAFAPLGAVLSFFDIREQLVAYLVAQGALQLLQWFVSGAVSTAAAGAAAALMWSEGRR